MLNTESSNEIPPTPPPSHTSYTIEALPTMSLSPLKMAEHTEHMLLPRIFNGNTKVFVCLCY
jgi:hypothetical protein